MPTLKDIAKKAGLSYGTVSNVINKRGNVSLEKILLVEKVANELGYFINKTASSLRANKKEGIAFIIPSLDDQLNRRIYQLLTKKATQFNISINLLTTDFNPLLEKKHFQSSITTNEFILISSCMDHPEDYYDNIHFNQSKIIFINTPVVFKNPNAYSVNFDFSQFFNDITNYIEEKKVQKTLIFSDIQINNRKIFDHNIELQFCSQPYNLSKAIEILSENTFDLIVSTSFEKFESIVSARHILNQDDEIDMIFASCQDLNFENKYHQYVPNLNLFVENIWSIVTKQNDVNQILTVPNLGLINSKERKVTGSSLNILMVESPSTSALLRIKPYIEKKLGFHINIDVIKYNEYEILFDTTKLSSYDLVRIDMAYLPEVASKIYKPISDKFTNLTKHFIENLEEYSYYQNQMYALPFDISGLIMLYRSDVINNQTIQREYYEETKKTNIIPSTFEEYNELEKFFNRNYRDIFKSSTVCVGSSITCGNEFMVRVSDDNILNEHGELNLENKNVIQALNSYLTSVSFSKNLSNRFWDDVLKEYSEGNTIMSIVFSNYVHMIKQYNKDILYKTEYTVVPGKKSLIGGGVIGLTKTTQKDDLCYAFLKTLYSDQIGKLLTHLGATMPIKSIYNDIRLLSMYPWLNQIPTIVKHNTRNYYQHDGTKFQTIQYEKTIGKLVRKYLNENLGNKAA